MEKETKKTLQIIFVCLIATFGSVYLIIWSSGIDEEYPLSYYGCENIELSFDYGYCLPMFSHNIEIFTKCHSIDSIERYYQLNCKEVSVNSSQG